LSSQAATPSAGGSEVVEAGLRDSYSARFDFSKVGREVVVRCRRAGDRFQPLGMDEPKKVGEFMIDAKIPRAWRERVPVVCSPEHIIWVVGGRIDERVKVTKDTAEVLCLEFARGEGPGLRSSRTCDLES